MVPSWSKRSLGGSLRDPVHMGKHRGCGHDSQHTQFKMLGRDACYGIPVTDGALLWTWDFFTSVSAAAKGQNTLKVKLLAGWGDGWRKERAKET